MREIIERKRGDLQQLLYDHRERLEEDPMMKDNLELRKESFIFFAKSGNAPRALRELTATIAVVIKWSDTSPPAQDPKET